MNTWTTVNELRQWNKSQPNASKVRHTLIHQPVVRKLYVKGKLQGFMFLSNFCMPYIQILSKKKVVRKTNRVHLCHNYILIVLHRGEICNFVLPVDVSFIYTSVKIIFILSDKILLVMELSVVINFIRNSFCHSTFESSFFWWQFT